MLWIPLALLALLGWRPIAEQPLPEAMAHIVSAAGLKTKFSKCRQAEAASPTDERAACDALAAQAIHEYEAALGATDLRPETKAMIHASLGDLHREQEKNEEALADYARCLALAPDNTSALEGHARASEALRRWADAAGDYRKLLARKPGESAIQLRLARICAIAADPKVRNPTEAVKLAKQVSDLRGGTDAEALGVYAEALYANGDTLSAIDAVKRAMVLSRDPAPYREMLDRYEKAQYGKVIPPAPQGEELAPSADPSPAPTEPRPRSEFPHNKGSLD